MLKRLVDFSLDNRPLVLIAAALLVAGRRLRAHPASDRRRSRHHERAGADSHQGPGPRTRRDGAVRDLPDRGGHERPARRSWRSAPISRYGLSAVTVVFEDDVNVYFARQLVAERLVQARETIPAGLRQPGDGPGHHRSRRGLPCSRSRAAGCRRWSGARSSTGMIAPRLRAVPGVTEVNAWGGLPKQYQVVVDPAKLARATASRSSRCSRPWSAAAATRAAATSSTTASSTSSAARAWSGSLADIAKIVLKAGAEGTPSPWAASAQVRDGGDAAHRRRDRGRARARPSSAWRRCWRARTRSHVADAGAAGGRGACSRLCPKGVADRAVLRPRGPRATA